MRCESAKKDRVGAALYAVPNIRSPCLFASNERVEFPRAPAFILHPFLAIISLSQSKHFDLPGKGTLNLPSKHVLPQLNSL